MELELKILKEKVRDDEKSTGLGGIFDDEKSSAEHIALLKSKYAAIRRDADQSNYENDRKKMELMGE